MGRGDAAHFSCVPFVFPGFARFLRAKIGDKVPESDAERIKRLIAELDDSSFRKRETAASELVRLGRLAEPAVRAALAGSPPAEQRQRLELLAARYKDGMPPDELRLRRAVQALRWYGDTEAKKLQDEWASGMEGRRSRRRPGRPSGQWINRSLEFLLARPRGLDLPSIKSRRHVPGSFRFTGTIEKVTSN